MTIRIKAISNITIKHKFFLATTTMHIVITAMTMIKIGSSLTLVNPWMPYFKNWWNHNLMVFRNMRPFDENQPKSKWYRENEY